MNDEKEYVERLEKILDRQDDLLSQFDAKFNQQDSLNEYLMKHNDLLKEDVQKHKNLLRDMNKSVKQHKNVVAKLKGELEEQLKIQQDLHKDYGEVIKGLTDELEEEQAKYENSQKRVETLNKRISALNNEITELKKELEKKSIDKSLSTSRPTYMDAIASNNTQLKEANVSKNTKNLCPECGAEVQEGYIFCDSCGTKLN